MEILNEKEVLDYLQLPSVPVKPWDKKTSFKDGVAVVNLYGGLQMYAVATFDSDNDTNPRIKKVFSSEPFYDIVEIFVVPTYMVTKEDVKDFDMDEASKEAAKALLDEAEELENEGTEKVDEVEGENPYEWIFADIHNMEEAVAWLKAYNVKNNIKRNSIPKTEESMKLRLFTIYETIKSQKDGE